MNEQINSVDFWVDELIKDTNSSHFDYHEKFVSYMKNDIINSFGKWMWNRGHNAGLVNLQAKVNTYCVPQWISVKDRLPEGCETVLICNANKKFVASGYYSPVEKRWNQIGNRFLLFTITHWMSLPEPPESKDDVEWKK